MYDAGEQDLGSESLWNCHSRTRCTMMTPSGRKQELKLNPERGRGTFCPTTGQNCISLLAGLPLSKVCVLCKLKIIFLV